MFDLYTSNYAYKMMLGIPGNSAATEIGKKLERLFPGMLVEKNTKLKNDYIYVKHPTTDGSLEETAISAEQWNIYIRGLLKNHSATEILVKNVCGKFIPFSRYFD